MRKIMHRPKETDRPHQPPVLKYVLYLCLLQNIAVVITTIQSRRMPFYRMHIPIEQGKGLVNNPAAPLWKDLLAEPPEAAH